MTSRRSGVRLPSGRPVSSVVEGKDYVVAEGDVMHFRFNV